jgi:hypothetical protein
MGNAVTQTASASITEGTVIFMDFVYGILPPGSKSKIHPRKPGSVVISFDWHSGLRHLNGETAKTIAMAYAIIQRELLPPSLEQLKRAYRSLPTLRDLDAQTSLNDAYGILLKGLEEPDASILRDALSREGIATEVLPEANLPTVPQARVVRALEFQPEQLGIIDPMGRATVLPWSEVLFVAAGAVGVQHFKRVKQSVPDPLFRGSGITYDTTDEVKSKEETQFHFMIDIIVVGAAVRYSIDAENFNFDYLSTRFTDSLVQNIAFVVQDLAQFAPHAGLNRGAFVYCNQPVEPFRYPSKAAYFEEMTWLMWRSGLASAEVI